MGVDASAEGKSWGAMVHLGKSSQCSPESLLLWGFPLVQTLNLWAEVIAFYPGSFRAGLGES
jgi:hypothetical protein